MTALLGCSTQSKGTIDQFAFLEVGMPSSVVANRVGIPDRGYREQIRLRYDLADGSEMVIVSYGGATSRLVVWSEPWRQVALD
jgi:hypothetical protein